jgi:hypothetical protein
MAERVALPKRIQGALDWDSNTKCHILWLHTADYVYGTYLELHPNGKVVRVTVRDDEGDDVHTVRPQQEK